MNKQEDPDVVAYPMAPSWLRAMVSSKGSGPWCSRIDIPLGARGPVPGRGLLPAVLLPIMAGYRKLSGAEDEWVGRVPAPQPHGPLAA